MTLRHAPLLALGLLAALARPASAQAPAIQILPLGDSITHGYTTPVDTPGGYRAPLLDALTARGYQVHYVGANVSDSCHSLDATGNSHHEGHSYYRIHHVANNLNGSDNSVTALGGESNDGGYWLTGIPGVRAPISPDLILLDIGTNDYLNYYDPSAQGGDGRTEYATNRAAFDAHAAARLDALIGKIVSLRPQAAILVGSILPVASASPVVSGFNSLIETQIVPKYRALGDHVSFVDQNAAFVDPATGAAIPGLYGADPVHPSAAGYGCMAQAWLHGIEAILPPPVPEPAHTLLLWQGADGSARVWTMDAGGLRVSRQVYGPLAGWTPTAVAVGPDGSPRLLWNAADGRVMLWNLADPHPAATGFTYGPFDGGPDPRLWAATGLAVGPDNAAHLLWNHPNGRTALWTVDKAGAFTITGGYGPYADGLAGNVWSATGLAVGPDGACRLLWNHPDGRATLWAVNPLGAFKVTGVYLPSNGQGTWRATALAVAPDDTLRLLWNDAGGHTALWRLTPGGVSSVTNYGPYDDGLWWGPGRATALSVGPDGVCHLLWSHLTGRVDLWDVDAAGGHTVAGAFGPYPSTSAIGLVSGP